MFEWRTDAVGLFQPFCSNDLLSVSRRNLQRNFPDADFWTVSLAARFNFLAASWMQHHPAGRSGHRRECHAN